ncbi:MAG TPA: insulinase family protein [Pseudomonadales bacterium]|nr:insulinase family protein [Pseudomonadales bacterium]
MTRSLLAALTALCLFFVVLPAHASQQLADPLQGEIDARVYRNLVLANGMKVLLISDPHTDKSAAALDVATGSVDDPRQRQGLAHFLEHMLFLGTKKYPEPGEYQAFISDNGGSHNAFTSLEHTNYFFDIDSQQLQPALDRFAQFFVEPLFNAAYVEREKNAVNSEYQARIRDDERRQWDVLRELFHANNPAATFSVGNLATLADTKNSKVRDDLLTFYQQHYSANTMTLVVLGRESLPQLQAMVEQFFNAVPDRKLSVDQSEKPVFRDGLLPSRVLVKSNQDERHLQLVFPLPSMQQYYRIKPDAYISYLLGHEGEGSLFSVLKQRGWAESLGAGSGLSNRFAATFDVDITLTEEGYHHINDIAALFFRAVQELKEKGLDNWRYDEQKALLDLSFRFHEKQDAMEYTSELANNLQYYPPEDVLRGQYLMEAMNAGLVQDVLSRINPSNVLVVISAPDIESGHVSEFYSTPYKVEPVTPDVLSAWKNVGALSGISLPPENVFIPDKLKLKKPPVFSTISAESKIPKKIVSSDNYNLWFLQDSTFNVPKGSVMVYARSRSASASVRDAAMAELFVRLLNDRLNPLLYTAHLSGLDFSISKRSRGINFQLTGYSDKQGLLLKSVMDEFRNPVFAEERFSLLKTQWADELRNADKQSPYMQLMQDMPVVLMHGNWGRKDYLQALDTIALKDVQDYMQEFSQTIQADVLVYGNFYEAEAVKLAKVVENTVNLSSAHLPDMPAKVVALPAVAKPYLYVDALEHSDAAIIKYFQASGDDVTQQVRMAMLAQVSGSPFFHSLRTQQQLGYIVSASYMPLARVPGISFLVQSPSTGVGDINQRADTFIREYFQFISAQNDAWFEQQKQALLTQLQEKPKSQAEQTAEFWADISLRYTTFDHREQQIAALQKMSKQDLLDTYRSVLLEPEHRELLLLSPGKSGMQDMLANPDKKYNPVDKLDEFKAALPSFSFQ